jgi:tRNA nucleotidyltransferase (CCA-adding enzyme)
MTTIDRNQIPAEVLNVLNMLKSNNYPSFLVGGCVRDLILNKQPKDYDICTKALPEQVKSLFARVIDTGIKYGTVTVLTANYSVEVTTFRKLVFNPDGPRASEITYGTTVGEDVTKRDFSINGLLFDGAQVIDLVGGTIDLQNRRIRGIEDPDARFREDPLRMVRAIRFCCQLDFEIEPITFSAIERNATLVANLSQERIRDEFNKILLSNRPDDGLRLLHQTGILKGVLPELEQCYGFEQRTPHHSQDVFEHSLTVVKNTPAVLKIRWAALLHDIGKPLTFSVDEHGIGHFYGHDLKGSDLAEQIMNRFKLDKKIIRKVVLLVREHMNVPQTLKRSTLKRLINRVGPENIDALLELQVADVTRLGKVQDVAILQQVKLIMNEVLREQEPMNYRDLAINGNDLKMLGIKPGKIMGDILSELLERVIVHPELNTRESLLNLIAKMEIEREGSNKDER